MDKHACAGRPVKSAAVFSAAAIAQARMTGIGAERMAMMEMMAERALNDCRHANRGHLKV
jgi:hypothetical protein